MSLRERQIGGIPLNKGDAVIVTIGLAICVPVIAYLVWFPLLGIPSELRKWLALLGVVIYIYQCTGRVPQGKERAQLFFGTYTGVSFPAGIYILPRIPFPIISLLLMLILKEDVSNYLGWTLEGDVSVESIVVAFFSEGLSKDGLRVRLKGTLVFEISNAAIFLSQNGTTSNLTSIKEALHAETSRRIKSTIIANSTTKDLYHGRYSNGVTLSQWITHTCNFIQDFGVKLTRTPVVTVEILSERMEYAFDADNAKSLLRDVSNETALAYADFVKKLPEGTSEEVALAFFNTARANQGLSPVDINIVKFK